MQACLLANVSNCDLLCVQMLRWPKCVRSQTYIISSTCLSQSEAEFLCDLPMSLFNQRRKAIPADLSARDLQFLCTSVNVQTSDQQHVHLDHMELRSGGMRLVLDHVLIDNGVCSVWMLFCLMQNICFTILRLLLH